MKLRPELEAQGRVRARLRERGRWWGMRLCRGEGRLERIMAHRELSRWPAKIRLMMGRFRRVNKSVVGDRDRETAMSGAKVKILGAMTGTTTSGAEVEVEMEAVVRLVAEVMLEETLEEAVMDWILGTSSEVEKRMGKAWPEAMYIYHLLYH